jgi:hypothetical protein
MPDLVELPPAIATFQYSRIRHDRKFASVHGGSVVTGSTLAEALAEIEQTLQTIEKIRV